MMEVKMQGRGKQTVTIKGINTKDAASVATALEMLMISSPSSVQAIKEGMMLVLLMHTDDIENLQDHLYVMKECMDEALEEDED